VTEAMHLVLIFEDDEGMQNVLRMLFEANGFRVVIAATAARGEQDARQYRPDVVVVDLGLPDRDGLNVIAAIRAWSSWRACGQSDGVTCAAICRWACWISAMYRSI
jgi:two-component system KDP operon response regulator KdpE